MPQVTCRVPSPPVGSLCFTAQISVPHRSLSTTSAVPVSLTANWLARLFKSTAPVHHSSTSQQHRWQQSSRIPFLVAPLRSRSRTRAKPQPQYRFPLLLPRPEFSHSTPQARDREPASIRTARSIQHLLRRRLATSSPVTRRVKARQRRLVLMVNRPRVHCPNRS